MPNSDLSLIFKKQNIELLEKVEFNSKSEEIEFLNKFQNLQKEGLKIQFLNQDLVNIFKDLKINKEVHDILRKTNWEDFYKAFKEKNENKRNLKIYNNFIYFLKGELGLISKEKPLIEKSLISDDKTKETKIDLSIFEPKEKFNIEQDKIEKARNRKVNILFDYNEPSHKITVNDFTLYFNKRLQYFTDLLKGRINMENVMRISQLRNLYDTNSEVSIIGLVSEINQTKNGHMMLTIEDKSAEIKCFINNKKIDPNEKEYSKELHEKIQNLCLDEGIGINGNIGNAIVWVNDIIIPSPPNSVELRKTENEYYVCFISDIHFGAKVFVDDAFQRFVDFLNGNTQNEELNNVAKKVKYIIVAGDVIEGIGIYPNQGKDARVLSTELQYHEAARWFSQIPKDKTIIIIPGNHDTDRLSEPQPKLPYHKAYSLYNMENVIMLSNPSIVRLFEDDPEGGLDFYLYHGGSIFYYADMIQNLREKGGAKTPEEVIKYLLEKRHLAPSHGSTLYIPDSQQDPLVIKKMPDFFITGHTHKLSLANYKGCTIISCGCWVEMSEYQEKMGMYPDIGKCTLINTKTRKPKIINFYTGDGKVVRRESSDSQI